MKYLRDITDITKVLYVLYSYYSNIKILNTKMTRKCWTSYDLSLQTGTVKYNLTCHQESEEFLPH